jgi:CBS domain containing-hemolysin-like protein
MPMNDVVGLILSTAFCLFFSTICSLFEAGLLAVPVSFVRVRAESGGRAWRLLLRLKENPDAPIAGILITNTLAHTAGATMAGFFAQKVFEAWGVGSWAMGVFTALLVLAILWFSEILPKTIGVVFAKPLAPLIAYPIQWLVAFWRPLIYITEFSTRIFTRGAVEAHTISEVELASLAEQGASEGAIFRHEARLIGQALRLDRLRAREIMTPRTVVFSLAADLTLPEAAKKISDRHYSRILVHRAGEPDQIEGFCLLVDIYKCLAGEESDKLIADLVRPIQMVSEFESGHVLLDKFLKSRKHIFAVIDEFGVFSGVVTLEDVLESVLGKEIMDETDKHADLRRVARDQALRQGLPVSPEPEDQSQKSK